MTRRIFSILFFIFSAFNLLPSAFAQPENLSFTKEDRVLIVAPHPDDEALGCAGIIQSALAAGAEVKIVYLTHGESNEISALFYQKKPMLVKTDFVKVGRLRKKEAVEAMTFLGVPEKNLIFFGYPDMGTMPIWEKFWTGKKPFRSYFARINKVIHDNDFSYGKYYHGYNIVEDFEKVLLESEPTHVFVTAPFDLNLDHQAAYLFLKVALLNLEPNLKTAPAVHWYLIHEPSWPKPRKYAPELELAPPGGSPASWNSFALTPEQTKKKAESLSRYESQLSYSKNFLLSFARKNEIYKDEPMEGLDIAGKKELLIEVPFEYSMDEMAGISAKVFSYKKGMPFTEMPKLHFRLFGKKLTIRDGLKRFSDPDISYKIENRRLVIRVPYKTLKDPDTLFVSTRTTKKQLVFDFGSWKAIQIKK